MLFKQSSEPHLPIAVAVVGWSHDDAAPLIELDFVGEILERLVFADFLPGHGLPVFSEREIPTDTARLKQLNIFDFN